MGSVWTGAVPVSQATVPMTAVTHMVCKCSETLILRVTSDTKMPLSIVFIKSLVKSVLVTTLTSSYSKSR